MSISDKALLHVLKVLEESDSAAIEVEAGGLRMRARKGGGTFSTALGDAPAVAAGHVAASGVATPAAPAAAATPAPAPAPADDLDGCVAVTSPMKGTFYRAPAPGEPAFCEVGDRVGSDDTVCLIEIMKLFNSIPAGVSGKVERILVENAAPVDLGQVIILIRPDK
jgi:acetyl-CoA carboxylase biotin carboxyl carrier protein